MPQYDRSSLVNNCQMPLKNNGFCADFQQKKEQVIALRAMTVKTHTGYFPRSLTQTQVQFIAAPSCIISPHFYGTGKQLVRILIIANTGWYLYKFRYNLIKALLARGHDICIACPPDSYSQQLVDELSVQCQSIPDNPRRIIAHLEALFVLKLWVAVHRYKPHYCITYTPRVNCYTALVPLKAYKTKLIRNISGVGESLNSGKKLQTLLATFLYQRAQNSHWTFYQNEQDMNLGINKNFCRHERTSLLPGSGVDLSLFSGSRQTFSLQRSSGISSSRWLFR